MRFIDLRKLKLPEGWEERARKAREDIVILAEDARASGINARRAVWSDLKELLGNLSFKKCWYCEARQERSDMQVDHFRPKNRVSEEGCDNHPGYWWLAFAWQNFRFCCTYCNSRREDPKTGTKGGKADRFPLREEAQRCRTPEDIISDEQPVLLDPTVRADPALLWFDEDGTARPNSGDEKSWPYRRAKESIEIYHLNHSGIKEARLAVSRECRRMIGEGDEAWKEYSRGSSVAEEKFRRAVESLGERLAETTEYSAAARSTIMGLRSEDRPWLDALLL